MFIFFSRNKLRYDKKGQFAPIFIAIMVILIVMTMITVNLNKIAQTKTHTSNSADAGGLAGGSAMANLFNAIAIMNSALETAYWEFYASMSVVFITTLAFVIRANVTAIASEASATAALAAANAALASAGSAASTACPNPCAAIGLNNAAIASITTGITEITAAIASMVSAIEATGNAITSLKAAIVAVTAFHIAQIYSYLLIRRQAEEGRDSAIKVAHQFSFINSNLGQKLKSGGPPEALELESATNYQDLYNTFFKALGSAPRYQYTWRDGQGRGHYVESLVGIDPVDTFDLRVTILPLPAELALLYAAYRSAKSAEASFLLAKAEYDTTLANYNLALAKYNAASSPLAAACACMGPCLSCCNFPCLAGCPCCVVWATMCAVAVGLISAGMTFTSTGITANTAGLSANAAGIAALKPIYGLIPAAWLGLLPGMTTTSRMISMIFTICWIDDVVHNRLVKVTGTQHHEGADLGLWQTEYPDTTSFSIVNFRGFGSIFPPVPRHDASIVSTDSYGGLVYDPCPTISLRIDTLRAQAAELRLTSGRLNAQAVQLEELIRGLDSDEPPRTEEINLLREQAEGLRQEANLNLQDADNKEAEAQNLITSNPDCNLN